MPRNAEFHREMHPIAIRQSSTKAMENGTHPSVIAGKFDVINFISLIFHVIFVYIDLLDY